MKSTREPENSPKPGGLEPSRLETWIKMQEETVLPPQTRIAWSKSDQKFVPVAETVVAVMNTPTRRGSTRDIRADVEVFVDWKGGNLDAFTTLRKSVLQRVLDDEDIDDGASAMSMLPQCIKSWQRVVKALPQQDDSTVLYAELYDLADVLLRIGDIVNARQTLGECIKLARSREPVDPLAIDHVAQAKALLLKCVRFQHSLQLCKTGLGRKHTPLHVLRAILAELTELAALTPYAISLMVLKVDTLQRMHRPKQVLTELEGFPFTDQSARLTLAYARALETEGFFQQSIKVAARFEASPPRAVNESEDSEEAKTLSDLGVHVRNLAHVLGCRAIGDDALVASKYQHAEEAFADALRAVRHDSFKLRAVLLFGRANALLGMDRVLSAHSELEASLDMDPTNQIARMRLRTLDLEMQTNAIYRRIQRG